MFAVLARIFRGASAVVGDDSRPSAPPPEFPPGGPEGAPVSAELTAPRRPTELEPTAARPRNS